MSSSGQGAFRKSRPFSAFGVYESMETLWFIHLFNQKHLSDTAYLHNCLGPRHLEHLPAPLSPIGEGEVDNLSVLGKLAGGESSPESQ